MDNNFFNFCFEFLLFLAEACNYLLVYEYVITADVGSDMWGGIKRMAATKGKVLKYFSILS